MTIAKTNNCYFTADLTATGAIILHAPIIATGRNDYEKRGENA